MHRIAPCAPYLPRRASDTNKYDYGRVLIVGGCIGYTGAPTLCARAALRGGAGLVSVGVPEAIYAVTAVKNDEAMPFPLPSAEGKLARRPAGAARAAGKERCVRARAGPRPE